MSTSFYTVVALAVFVTIGQTRNFNRPFAAVIPRTWDDAAIQTQEVPLAHSAYSPIHITADYYYRMPVRPIYQSYPVYAAGHEPAGYTHWLTQQSPVVLWDDHGHHPRLETEADWIRAGEMVFDSAFNYDDLGFLVSEIRDPVVQREFGGLVARDGSIPFLRYVVRTNGSVELGQFSCMMCHTRVLPDRSVVKGAQGNVNLNRASAHSRTSRSTADQVRSDYRSTYGLPWLTPQAEAERSWLPLAEAIAGEAAIPAGVFPRHRSSLRSPVQVPDLFGVQDRHYLDRSGLVQQRDVADLMRYAALNQNADDFASFGGFIPIAPDLKTRPAAEDRSLPGRFSDEQLYALALYLSSLKPPVNPNLPKTAPQVALVKRGEKIFRDSDNSCATCHKPPLYTNNKLMPVIGFNVPEDHRTKYDISDRRMDTDPGLTLETRRGTGYYKVPSLRGVWLRTPLEHNGSCATLEDWFSPARTNDTYIPTGWKGPPGTKTRAVRGHEFGLDLSPGDKLALIAFLKTL